MLDLFGKYDFKFQKQMDRYYDKKAKKDSVKNLI